MKIWRSYISRLVVVMGALLLSLVIQLWLLDYYLADIAISAMRDFEAANPGASIDEVARIGDLRLAESGVLDKVYGQVDYIAAIPFFFAALVLSGRSLLQLSVLILLSIATTYPRIEGMTIYIAVVIIGWLIGVFYKKLGSG